MMTPEEQKAADEKAAADKETARLAALKKANEALVSQPVVVEGDAVHGGPFSISGEGFGMQGSLKVAGETVKITKWTDRSIKGVMPAGLSGDVVLKGAFGERHGKWPYVRPTVTKTTTTVVETK